MIIVFVDTNVLLPDPFLSGEFSQLIIKFSKKNKIKLVIPSIVLDELKNKLTVRTLDEYNILRKKAHSISKLIGQNFKYDEFNVKIHLNRLIEFYNYHFDKKHFEIINYKNSFLPELVNRSIKGIKPFTQKKQEFRDGIIWLSIIEYIKKNENNDSYFFATNNIAEFYDNDKINLHSELKKDYSKIQLYKSFKELILNEKDLFIQKELHDFEQWLSKQNIDNYYLKNEMLSSIWSEIESEISLKIKSSNIGKIYNSDIIGYLMPTINKNNFRINNYEVYPVEKFALLNCDIELSFFAKIFKPDLNELTFTEQGIGEYIFQGKLSFTIDYTKKLSYSDIESYSIELQ